MARKGELFNRVGKGYYGLVGTDYYIMFRSGNRLTRRKKGWVVRLNAKDVDTFKTLTLAKEYLLTITK